MWFSKFINEVKDRPLLLLLDEHLTHISTTLIETALDEDITILKLPPHKTDKLQPLDVTCFGPLKREWEKQLNEWIWGLKQPMKIPMFVDKLSKIWHRCLTEDTIKSGFGSTSVFPPTVANTHAKGLMLGS